MTTNASSVNYEKMPLSTDDIEQQSRGDNSEIQSPNTTTERDPLYAALLGTKVGTAMGGPADRETRLNTLDEPVQETIKRDLRMVFDKTWMIMTLSEPEVSLRDWDLWGPLVNSLLLSISLGMRSGATVSTFTFTFTLIWLGVAVITTNGRLLGYRFPILPTISFLGYSLSPLALASVIWMFLPGFFYILKVLLALSGFTWSLMTALRLTDIDPALEDKRLLAYLPFVLYFMMIAWSFLIS